MTIDDHTKLGTARLEKGEYDEAISEFAKAILSVLIVLPKPITNVVLPTAIRKNTT